ncbi:MAG: hypothetical protein U0704_00185 [Candidatus Eisenbacteria bacterium]
MSTPWGDTFPGFAIVGFIYDEYLHHWGCTVRVPAHVRVEPIMLRDFDHSARRSSSRA